MPHYDIALVGGGLAGLTMAVRFAQEGYAVVLVERRQYPFHKVCGEYVSNEVGPYLQQLGLNLAALAPAAIHRLEVTTANGARLSSPLGLGGFGISRYRLDEALYKLAQQAGVTCLTATRVVALAWDETEQQHHISLAAGEPLQAPLVIGSYGKREALDRQLNRPFLQYRTGYLGVKYHVSGDFDRDSITLHLFKGGYCGISAIEENKYCLCYLARRDDLKRWGSIPALEGQVLSKNPALAEVLQRATYLYERPEVINEISFAPKQAVEQHIWMAGDAAGLITPLCGNGMAMAIHGGKLLADLVVQSGYFGKGKSPSPAQRQALEAAYSRTWRRHFGLRLRAGRLLQGLFNRPQLVNASIRLCQQAPALTRGLIGLTHGQPF